MDERKGCGNRVTEAIRMVSQFEFEFQVNGKTVTRKPTAVQIANNMKRSRKRVAYYMRQMAKPPRGRPLELPEGCRSREDHGNMLKATLYEMQDGGNTCATALEVRTTTAGRVIN